MPSESLDFNIPSDPLIDAARAAFWQYQESMTFEASPLYEESRSVSAMPQRALADVSDLLSVYDTGVLSSDDLGLTDAEAALVDLFDAVGQSGGAVVFGDGQPEGDAAVTGTDGGDLLFGGMDGMDAETLLALVDGVVDAAGGDGF